MDRAGLGRKKSNVVARASGKMTVSSTQERSQVAIHRALLSILSRLDLNNPVDNCYEV